MRLLSSAAAAAVLAFAAPALAQETVPPAPPAQAPAAAPAEAPKSPEEAALEAKGQAFEAQIEQMSAELQAVVEDDSKDAAAKTAETNTVIDRYAPAMTTFGGEVEAFLKAESEKPENAEKKDQMLAAATTVGERIRSMPDQIRAGVQQAIAAQAAAPAAAAPAEAPATPQ
ncbi:translation initiation factor IF-2 [Brevundimonas sp.]|jgi:hypothetical protein|uniref:translation initiation factor IF-2 n=1 Tax=Brevundimonas sp. TaxID=1871086 RepID=UPI0037C03209